MKIDNELARSKRKIVKKSSNPIWSVVWRFLLVCLILDGGIYFYFHKIQHTTVSEGIKKIRATIYGNGQRGLVTIENNIATIQPKIKEHPERKIIQIGPAKTAADDLNQRDSRGSSSKRNDGLYAIYCWEDENRNRHFSNTGYPTFGKFKIIKFP